MINKKGKIILSTLDPAKLKVEYCGGITSSGPIFPRRYTLTHSDTTGELFLTLAPNYAYNKIKPLRDEVLGEWRYYNNKYVFYASVYVDGEFGPDQAERRNSIFIRELPLALSAIRYGDSAFFAANPILKNAPIYVYFDSSISTYNRMEYWGPFSEYN